MAAELRKTDLISTGEAAVACGVSTQTIVNWIRQGRLRAATTGGGRFRVHVDSLVEFLRLSGFEIPPELKGGPSTVYILDHDPAWLAAARKQLAPLAKVETFSEGIRGLVAIAARPPSLVVLDMKLPGLDGASVLHALRHEEATRSLPIVVATAIEEEAALARRYGATAAVTKAHGSRLKETVERLLN
jgi:excisionase family DNA binding protein